MSVGECGRVWPVLTECDRGWPRCGRVWPSVAECGRVWPSVIVYVFLTCSIPFLEEPEFVYAKADILPNNALPREERQVQYIPKQKCFNFWLIP